MNYGDTTAFTYFEKHPAQFTAESGVDGTFYLHPNASGAKYLAGLWADALMKVLSDDGIKEVSEDERYVMGEDLITDTFQLSTNTMESYQFSPSNLILPETDGYGTGQFIYHCAWTHPLPSGQYPYIQVKLYKPETDIYFSFISSEWTSTYDSPRDLIILATNTPADESSWVEVTTLTDMATAVAHPIKYTSPHIALGGSYSYLRFICTRNVTGRLTANGGPLFNMGRFMVMRADKADNPKAKLQLTLDNIYNKGLNYAGGTEPGYYNGEKVDNFIIAYEDASAGISGDLGDDDATKLYNALTTAYSDMMATYIPVKPGYYHFISALPRFESTQGVKKAMCILPNGHLGWDTYNEKDPRFLFQVEALSDSTYSIRSVYNNKYISYYGGAGVNIPMTDEQVTPQLIDQIGTYPQFHIANTSFYVPYHAAGHNGGSGVSGDIVAWQDNADTPSAWYLLTETDEALIDSLTKAAAKEYLADQVSTAINSTGAIRDLANDYTALLTDGSQITANSVEADQFAPANLLRPVSDGYGTGQYIFHTSWSNPLPASTYPYLQVYLPKAMRTIKYHMISSEWGSTYDTPTEIEILATNDTNDATSWKSVYEQKNIITKMTHPVIYTSPTIDLGADYQALRFVVKSTINNRGKSATTSFYLSLGRFQMYTGVDPNTVQYNYNPEVKEAADALKALVDADKAITRLSVKASDITVLEEAISKLSASFADTTEFTSLYRNTKDWIAQILMGEEFGDADSQDNVDAFVNTINSIRQNTNTYQPKKAELAAAVEELKKAKKDFVDNHIKHIEANKWYYIISNSTLEYCNGMSMVSYSSDGNSEIHYGTTDQNGESLYYSPQAMWRFVPIEGTDYYGIQNMASAHFYGPTSGQGRDHTCRMQASISPFRIDYIGKSQIHFVSINSNNPDEIPIHAQNEQHVIVPWQAGIDAASSWTVMEVDDSELLNNTVKENSINLMTLPYDIPGGSNSLMSLNSNIKTYSIKNVVADYETGSTKVELTINDDIKAGVPFVLIEGDYTQYNAETAANVTFNTNIPATVDTIVGTANGLVATSEGADISTKGMIYTNGTLQMVADSPVHIGGLSAWIDASKVTPAEGDADLTISLLGIVNGIQPAAVTGSSDKVNVYTLDGVLVKKGVKASEARKDLKPGTIYIIGGKKVLIK